MPTNFVSTVHATWQAELQAQEIAAINAQMTAHRLSAQLFFRFSPIIMLMMSPAFKARLGVTSAAAAALYANQGLHTLERHRKEAFEILATRTEEHLTYIGRDSQQSGQFELVFSHKLGRHLYMPIKFIPSGPRAAMDECWISTAFVINDRELQRKIRTKHLQKQP
jgi:hypothetical protein